MTSSEEVNWKVGEATPFYSLDGIDKATKIAFLGVVVVGLLAFPARIGGSALLALIGLVRRAASETLATLATGK